MIISRVCQLLLPVYKRFFPNSSPTDLTKGKKNPVCWHTETTRAFEDIKQALCKRPVLYTPDLQRTFYLQTDALGTILGTVLFQKNQGEERLVAYARKKLLKAETCYSTIKHECLSIRCGVELFRYYLLGRRFILIIDHALLKWLQSAKTDNVRLTQCSLALQPFYFTVEPWVGRSNVNADFLSRPEDWLAAIRTPTGTAMQEKKIPYSFLFVLDKLGQGCNRASSDPVPERIE